MDKHKLSYFAFLFIFTTVLLKVMPVYESSVIKSFIFVEEVVLFWVIVHVFILTVTMWLMDVSFLIIFKVDVDVDNS